MNGFEKVSIIFTCFPSLFSSQGKMNLTHLPYTLDLLRRKIYETEKICPSTQNDIRLDAIFSILLVCTPRYGQAQAEIRQFVISLISLIFSGYNAG